MTLKLLVIFIIYYINITGICHYHVSTCPSIDLSIHLSQVNVLLKQLYVESHKQCQMIAQGL